MMGRKRLCNIGALIILLAASVIGSAFASVEQITYTYNERLELTGANYDDVKNLYYTYDEVGNRLTFTKINAAASSNNNPSTPNYSSPPNGSTDQSVNIQLSWDASTDPDQDDIIFYNVYIGETTEPPLVANGISTTSYTARLEPERTYYWKVRASDNRYGFSEGGLWSFSTGTVSTLTADFTYPGSIPGPFSDLFYRHFYGTFRK